MKRKRLYTCAQCNRKLTDRWIVGRDRRITGSLPRYCWIGEGCWTKAKRKVAA